MYEDGDYNLQAPYNANWWGYGDNNCLPMPAGFDNRASSLRFTGAPDDWNFDTLNLYFNEFFIGNEARGIFLSIWGHFLTSLKQLTDCAGVHLRQHAHPQLQ